MFREVVKGLFSLISRKIDLFLCVIVLVNVKVFLTCMSEILLPLKYTQPRAPLFENSE